MSLIPFPSADLDEMLDGIESLRKPKHKVAYFYHLCPLAKMDNIIMVRGFVCNCGARAEDHDLGPYAEEEPL